MRYLLLALFLVSPVFAQTANQTAVVRWNAVTQYTDGSVITDPVSYNVYIGTSGPGSEVSTPDTVSILSAKIGNYAAGQTIYVEVSATVNGVEGARSAEVSYLVGSKTPAQVGGVTVSPN